MTDAEYYKMKAAFEAKRAGNAVVNVGFAFMLPFVWLMYLPLVSLKIIYYIGGLARIAATSAGRAAIVDYLDQPVYNEQRKKEVSNEPNLANGFNPDLDSDWVGAAQTRREERLRG